MTCSYATVEQDCWPLALNNIYHLSSIVMKGSSIRAVGFGGFKTSICT